jgi:DNA-directed RNA polymerase specialized sigma24 family protein
MPTRLDRDEELLEALRQHEPTAAERLVATYGDRAYRLATRITGNGQDAEEVVSNLEIVEVLGLSIPAVKSRVHRARLFLRKQLSDVMATLDGITGP